MPYGRQHNVTKTYTQDGIDQGLRKYMLSVYNYMLVGLGLTGFIAYLVHRMPALQSIVYSNAIWLIILAELGLVFYLAARIQKLKFKTAQTLFWVYSALNGLTIGAIVMMYTGESVARVFFITASLFGALSLFGYTTKRDLSSWGSFLFAGLIAFLIGSIVNIFLGSSLLYFAMTGIGIIVFIGLIAYDTQKIKSIYYETDSSETTGKKAILGALALYLDFINLFILLLRLLGNRE